MRDILAVAVACTAAAVHVGFGLVGVEFNAPPDTIEVISEAVFTANHLTDTDKQNSTGKYKQTQCKSEKAVADPGFLQGGCGSWCLWSAPSPFMPSLPPTVKKISWELAAR